MSLILFETSRLFARPLTVEHEDALYAVYGDADAMRWVGDGEPLDRVLCHKWVEVTHNNYAVRGYGMMALVERATDEVIGFCGIVHPDGQENPELKYALKREFWGRGLATEAARGALVWGAETFGLPRIMATVALEHLASQNVLRKAGMKLSELRQNEDGSVTQVFMWKRDDAQKTFELCPSPQ
ncbi:MAG: GNAT family N-acetyltransferase [Armatimonadetes bacterium]|nr:GNAT family N-acetyltransferase [Armatimonadota bacterium]